MKSKKGFDCVEMKRRAQAKIYEEIKNLSPREELAYWKRQELAFKKEFPEAKRKSRISRKPKALHV